MELPGLGTKMEWKWEWIVSTTVLLPDRCLGCCILVRLSISALEASS